MKIFRDYQKKEMLSQSLSSKPDLQAPVSGHPVRSGVQDPLKSLPAELRREIFLYFDPQQTVAASQSSKSWAQTEQLFFPGRKKTALTTIRNENGKKNGRFLRELAESKELKALPLFPARTGHGSLRPTYGEDMKDSRGVFFTPDSKSILLPYKRRICKIDIFKADFDTRTRAGNSEPETSVHFAPNDFCSHLEEQWADTDGGLRRAGASPAGKFFFRHYSNGKFVFSPFDHLTSRTMVVNAANYLGMLTPVFLADDKILVFLPDNTGQHAIAMPVDKSIFDIGTREIALPPRLPEPRELGNDVESSLMALEPMVQEAYRAIWPTEPSPRISWGSKVTDDSFHWPPPFLKNVIESPDKRWRVQKKEGDGYWIKPSQEERNALSPTEFPAETGFFGHHG